MIKYLLPDEYYNSIYEIDIGRLKSKGIKAFICDIDNTLVTYDDPEPTNEVYKWLHKVKDSGFSVSFVSNNNLKRVERFNSRLKYFALHNSGKPSRKGLRAAIAAMGSRPENTALIGDQLFTDIFAGKRMELHCILVKPIKDKKTLLFAFKRLLERPFLYYYDKRRKQ